MLCAKWDFSFITACIVHEKEPEAAASMVIDTSAIIETELDGAIGMNSGIFNNPFLIWGKYKKKLFWYYLPISFWFLHTQMDGSHAGRFLSNLQNAINRISQT